MRMCLSNADDITDEYVYIDWDTTATKMEGVEKKDGKNRRKKLHRFSWTYFCYLLHYEIRSVLFSQYQDRPEG